MTACAPNASDAVKHEQQRRLGEIVQHVVECLVRHASVDDGNDALMLVVSRERGKACVVDGVHFNAGGLGAFDQFAYATIVARAFYIEAAYAQGLRPQSSDHGMESEQMARIGHEQGMRGTGAARVARLARVDALRYNL